MRCFISIDLDKELMDKVINIQEKLKNLDIDVKFVEPENLHFTIKFLGDVNLNEVDEIKRLIKGCLINENEFAIKVSDLGYFGKHHHIRTLWLGVKEGEQKLIKLMKKLNDCVKFGEREVSPHLTIGRVKSDKNREYLLNFLNECKNVNIGEMCVNEVKLKLSTLTKKGPIYNDLATFKVGS